MAANAKFAASLTELSELADRCLVAGLECATNEIGSEPPALLALGKLGGSELNFSSDVDLLFLYQRESDNELEQNQRAATLIRQFKTHMEAPSVDGFGYRVDLDLRPEGKTGVLANSVEAALGYYESFGAEWERQMLIRLRAVAGPKSPADAFTEGGVELEDIIEVDSEFLAEIGVKMNKIELKKLERWKAEMTMAGKLFDCIDRDRNGTLDIEELRDYLVDNALSLLSTEIDLFAMLDVDGNGVVSKDEFRFQFTTWQEKTAGAKEEAVRCVAMCVPVDGAAGESTRNRGLHAHRHTLAIARWPCGIHLIKVMRPRGWKMRLNLFWQMARVPQICWAPKMARQ